MKKLPVQIVSQENYNHKAKVFIHPFIHSFICSANCGIHLGFTQQMEGFTCAELGTELGVGDFAENRIDVDPCFSDGLDPECGEMRTLFS